MTVWTDFVKQYAKEKNLSYKEAMTSAKQHYTKKVKLNIIEEQPKKKKLKMPSPYRKVKLNIIEDDPDAIELPKIEPPEPQTRELTETIETTEEQIKPKKKKSRKVKLDIQGEYIPPIVSKTEEELNKTPIAKLKEMLKELNFTKFAKFKKQDYVDKILELKNIPKGVWWRYKYDFLYHDLKELYSYLNNDKDIYYNIKQQKKLLQQYIDKLEILKKKRMPGGEPQIRMTKILIEGQKSNIKKFDRLSNIDFEKEVEKLENEDAERKKRFADANKKHDPISRPKIEPPPTQTRQLTETIETKDEPIKSSPYKNIIEEWDTVNLPYLLFQEQPKIYDAIEKKILTLAKKKSSVVIPDLLFFIKPFLNELFVHYGSNKTALDIIQTGMANLVISMGYDEDKVFKDNTEYLGKHFNKTHKKIISHIFK